MKEKRLIPKRRFKEFINDEAWEQRKFFELVNRISMNSENKVLPRVEYEDIISGQGILNKDLYLKENNKKGNEFKENDILFGYLRPYLDNRLLACFNGIAVGDWWVLRSQNCNVDFIYSLIQTQKFQSIANLSTGTKMPRASWSTVASAEYLVPSNIKEQSKIGTFFSNFDNLITLHQRKLQKLKETKSAYLSEMFPKEGEKYPKRRFAGFTDPWEQIKMKDIFPVIRSGNRLPKDSIKKGDIPYVIATVGNNGVFMEIDESTLDYHGNDMRLFEAPSITFSIDNPEAIFLQERPFYTSNIMRVLNNKSLESVDYLFFLETLRKLTGGFDWSIKFSGPIVLNLDIMIPMNKEKNEINFKEIRKIGMFFHNLDNQIKMNQRKLEKLENLKKAYLNEMFV